MASANVNAPAGFWIRLGAGILDGIIVGITVSILSAILFGDFDYENNPLTILELLYAIIVPVIWRGYVIGKRLVGIRIVKLDGSDVGFGTMLMRVVVAAIVYLLTLGIGLIVSAFMVGLREDKRAIHDMIAGTYVTRLRPDEMEL